MIGLRMQAQQVPDRGVYATPFGSLTANTVNGNVPRNLGTMPSLWRWSSDLEPRLRAQPEG